MLFELKNALIPQDMKVTISHGERIDALEYVIKQANRTYELEQQNIQYRKIIDNMKLHAYNPEIINKIYDGLDE